MKRKRKPGRDHWINNQYWKLAVGEWIGLTLFFLTIVLLFCLFFIRRQTVEYRMQHTFGTRDPAFIGSALALANPLLISGNKIERLQNGDEFFPAMLQAIRGAAKTINFEAYIFYSDKIGNEFRDAFREKAQAGVEVRILLDGIGSGWQLNNSDVELMQKAGCKVAYYHPTHSWRVDRTNRRTHRRVLVVDGKLAFTGAVGFADKWSGHAQDKDHWRDAQMRVEGPLVAKLQAAFQDHWVKAYGEALSGAGQFPALSSSGNLKAQAVESRSFTVAPIPLLEAVAFTAAEREILISNSYCTPSKDQVAQLVNAVARGVDVRLLVPGPNNDQPLTKSAGRTAYGKLLEGGVKIFEYQPTMMHEKSMVVDGILSLFGSSNFDTRSSEINEELDLVVYDENFGRAMETNFENDLKQAQPYTLEQFRSRSLWERTIEWLVQPFRSQL